MLLSFLNENNEAQRTQWLATAQRLGLTFSPQFLCRAVSSAHSSPLHISQRFFHCSGYGLSLPPYRELFFVVMSTCSFTVSYEPHLIKLITLCFFRRSITSWRCLVMAGILPHINFQCSLGAPPVCAQQSCECHLVPSRCRTKWNWVLHAGLTRLHILAYEVSGL